MDHHAAIENLRRAMGEPLRASVDYSKTPRRPITNEIPANLFAPPEEAKTE